jgi:predicted phosphate transport protein (TIGR00153 family)
MFNLLPREDAFERMFSEMAGYLIEGAQLLENTLKDYNNVDERVRQLKEIEHKCDDLTHKVHVKLHQTFITPFDREDIHALAGHLDDVLDFIYAAGERLTIFGIAQPPASAAPLAGVIVKQAEQLKKAVSHINRHQDVLNCCVEINRLENEADRLVRSGLGELFKTERDPITLIKLKELIEVLETATDKAEDAANVLESIVLKMA